MRNRGTRRKNYPHGRHGSDAARVTKWYQHADCYRTAASAAATGPSRLLKAAPRREHQFIIASSDMGEIRFRDRAGWQWQVVESSKRRASDGNEDHERALYFLNRYETRRIADFPSDWAKRPSKELIKLCEGAEPL